MRNQEKKRYSKTSAKSSSARVSLSVDESPLIASGVESEEQTISGELRWVSKDLAGILACIAIIAVLMAGLFVVDSRTSILSKLAGVIAGASGL